MTIEYADLLLDNGELVRIEYKSEHQDDLLDSIDNARKRGDWWSVLQFEGTSATYMGVLIDRVAMNRVVAML